MNTDRQSYELDPILVPVRDDSGHDVGSCSVTLPDPEQHRAVAELVASERHYRLLSENASDVVCLLDMGNVMRWVSSSVESVLGWQPEDLLGTSPLEIVHPDDRAAVTERRVELSTGTAAGALELRVRRADGDFRWMSVHTRPTINAAGVVDGAVLGLRDVHDTVLARNALAESEHHYRLLSANATDAVFLTDLTGVVTWVSPAIRQVLGYDPADLVGSDRNSWVHPDDLPQVDAVVARLIEGEVGVAFEVRGRTSAGEYRWMSGVASIAFDLDGDVIGLIAAMRDITEQVAAREQAARNERMFHLAMDGAPQGMAVVALDGTFLQVNPALCAMLGRDEQWLLAHSIQDVMHPDDLDEDRSGRDELLRGASSARIRECRWRKSDNTELWVLQSTGLLRDEQELSLFYVSHVQDNTAAHRAKMELSYRASHDPLTGLINRDQLRARLSEVVNHPPPARRLGRPAVLRPRLLQRSQRHLRARGRRLGASGDCRANLGHRARLRYRRAPRRRRIRGRAVGGLRPFRGSDSGREDPRGRQPTDVDRHRPRARDHQHRYRLRRTRNLSGHPPGSGGCRALPGETLWPRPNLDL